MLEQWLAGIGLVVCAVLALGIGLGAERRARWRYALQRRWTQRKTQRSRRQAQREADAAIDRARRASAAGRWEGNVFRPTSFDPPKDKTPER